MKKYLLLLLLVASTVHAQTTWNGGTFTGTANGVTKPYYFQPFWMTFGTPAPVNVVTGTTSGTNQIQDKIYGSVGTVSTATSYQIPISWPLDMPVTPAITRVSSGTSVLIPDAVNPNLWDYTGTGTATVTISTTYQSQSYVLTTSTASATNAVFTSFAPTSTAYEASSEVDTRLVGLTASNSLAMFTSRNDATATYVRSGSFWAANVDFTSFAVWNSFDGDTGGPTLITPQDVVSANHLRIPNGTTVRFVTGSNAVVTGTIVSGSEIGVTDIWVGHLSGTMAGITPALVLPSPYTSPFPTTLPPAANYPVTWPVAVIRFNQFKQGAVGELQQISFSLAQTLIYHTSPSTATRKAFYLPVVTGDSGSPAGLIINGHFVLLNTWFYGGTGIGPSIADYTAQINAALSAMGSSYSLTPVNLSGFTQY